MDKQNNNSSNFLDSLEYVAYYLSKTDLLNVSMLNKRYLQYVRTTRWNQIKLQIKTKEQLFKIMQIFHGMIQTIEVMQNYFSNEDVQSLFSKYQNQGIIIQVPHLYVHNDVKLNSLVGISDDFYYLSYFTDKRETTEQLSLGQHGWLSVMQCAIKYNLISVLRFVLLECEMSRSKKTISEVMLTALHYENLEAIKILLERIDPTRIHLDIMLLHAMSLDNKTILEMLNVYFSKHSINVRKFISEDTIESITVYGLSDAVEYLINHNVDVCKYSMMPICEYGHVHLLKLFISRGLHFHFNESSVEQIFAYNSIAVLEFMKEIEYDFNAFVTMPIFRQTKLCMYAWWIKNCVNVNIHDHMVKLINTHMEDMEMLTGILTMFDTTILSTPEVAEQLDFSLALLNKGQYYVLQLTNNLFSCYPSIIIKIKNILSEYETTDIPSPFELQIEKCKAYYINNDTTPEISLYVTPSNDGFGFAVHHIAHKLFIYDLRREPYYLSAKRFDSIMRDVINGKRHPYLTICASDGIFFGPFRNTHEIVYASNIPYILRSSLLIRNDKFIYTYIGGATINIFRTKEEITQYYSYVNQNDVTYGWAKGNEFVYLPEIEEIVSSEDLADHTNKLPHDVYWYSKDKKGFRTHPFPEIYW